MPRTPRNALANARFEAFISSYDSAAPQIAKRVRDDLRVAFGMTDVTTFNDEEYPIVGFYADWSSNVDVMQFYILTPGRFIKYELSSSSMSLLIEIPSERISRIQRNRTASPDGVTATDVVKIEFEAEFTATNTTYSQDKDGNVTTVARTVYPDYTIIEQPEGTTSYREFVTALTNVLGR